MDVDDTSSELVQEPTTTISLATKKPPFLGRLTEQALPIETEAMLDFLEQLKKMVVKISLLDAIKEVPIYTKAIKEAYTTILGRKKDPKTIHVLG